MKTVSGVPLLVSLVSLTACALGDGSDEKGPSRSRSTAPLIGPNTEAWQKPDAPFGGVGRIQARASRLLCPDGRPATLVPGNPRAFCPNDASPIVESGDEVGGDCTGTLIERDLVLTAGHCFCEKTINRIRFQTANTDVYLGFPDSISLHVDDCGGSEEDDASQDLALFRLTAPVPEDVVNAPLLIPYLWDDILSRAQANEGVWIAGYGGDDGGGSERPLLVGTFNPGVDFNFQTGNWFVPWGSGSYWISFVSDVNVTGVIPVGGDSGAPLVVKLSFDGKRYIIAVHKGDNSRGWSESRELLSPTWNNGDGNGDWIRGHLSDADQDEVPDGEDNCSGDSSPRCAESPDGCYNPDQDDRDGDFVGDKCDNCPDLENVLQLDADRDRIGDDCDACPTMADSLTTALDSDGDGVPNSCDNCPEVPNGYVECNEDEDCPVVHGNRNYCTGADLCLRQFDDADDDRIGDPCDPCRLVAERELGGNSNSVAEERLGVEILGDACDPVPLYIADPILERRTLEEIQELDPEADQRNLRNSVAFEASAQIGHDLSRRVTPAKLADLSRQPYQADTGFRHCDCFDEDVGTPRSEDECRRGQCNPDPRAYDQQEAATPWKSVTVAFGNGFLDDITFDSDLPRGATLARSHNADLFESSELHRGSARRRMGSREFLVWSFWKDLAVNGLGGQVGSHVVAGQIETHGLFWSHTLPSAGLAASDRDEEAGQDLRNAFVYLSTPQFELEIPTDPLTAPPACVLCNLPWIRPELFPVDPDPRNLSTGLRGALRDASRIFPVDGRVRTADRDERFDVTLLLAGRFVDLLASTDTEWLTPAEPSAVLAGRRDAMQLVAIERPWSGARGIEEFIGTAAGTIEQAVVPSAAAIVPGPRQGAAAVLSGTERAVFLVGGTQQGPGGGQVFASEIWRYDLDSAAWRALGEQGTVAIPQAPILAATYRATSRELVLLSQVRTLTAWSEEEAPEDALHLTVVDTDGGAARDLAHLPALQGAEGASLTTTPSGTLILAVQTARTIRPRTKVPRPHHGVGAHRPPLRKKQVELFELELMGARPAWVGYARLDGELSDAIVFSDQLQVPILRHGTQTLVPVSQELLAERRGAEERGDRDRDSVPDFLDDCQDAFNPEQEGCVTLERTALYASERLTVGAGVVVDGVDEAPALLASGGATVIGDRASLGSVLSVGKLVLGAKVRSTGQLASSADVRFRSHFGRTRRVHAGVPLRVPDLALDFAYPPIDHHSRQVVKRGRRAVLAPGGYAALWVQNGAEARLSSGDYFLDELRVDPGGALLLDKARGRAVRLYVRSSLLMNGTILDYFGGDPEVLIVYTGDRQATLSGFVVGNVVAPRAKLVLAGREYFGAFFARELEVGPHATIRYYRAGLPWLP